MTWRNVDASHRKPTTPAALYTLYICRWSRWWHEESIMCITKGNALCWHHRMLREVKEQFHTYFVSRKRILPWTTENFCASHLKGAVYGTHCFAAHSLHSTANGKICDMKNSKRGILYWLFWPDRKSLQLFHSVAALMQITKNECIFPI